MKRALLIPSILRKVTPVLLLLGASSALRAAGTLTVYMSAPAAQSTTVGGASTETFDALSTGVKTAAYTSTAGIGVYNATSTNPFAVLAHDVFGGATDSGHTSPTNYMGLGSATSTSNPISLTLAHPAAYFGFWWSAGDASNRIDLFSGSTLLATFSTQDLLTFLNNGVGNVTALSGATYPTTNYFGNPNIATGSRDATEPFVYISFAITGATIDKINFYNLSTSSNFETDNHSFIASGGTVTIPTTFVQVETLSLTPTVAPPTFSPITGTYTSVQTVTISSATSGASIRYTTDGSTPTTTVGTLYSGPVTVGVSETIKAIAFATGLNTSAVSSAVYTINLPVTATPTFSPVAGTYTSVQNVTISSTTTGASFRYTTDGSTPTSSVGTLYSGPVSVGATETLKAIAFKTGMTDSAVGSAAYTINLPVANPTFSPAAGTYTSVQNVTISTTTSGASIRYTTDGTTPSTTAGTLYSGPVSVGVTETLKAIAFKTGLTSSAVVSAAYTINLPVATPTFSPTAGSYTSVQTVTISTATSGASIRYTTDGSTPSSTVGTLYSAPVSVGVTETINAIAFKTGLTNSAVAAAAYTINLPVANPTFSPTAGTYTSVQSVTISSTTSGASFRYTTDGSTPTSTVGTLYSGPVSVGVTETLKAIAFKSGMTDSAVTSAAYTINLPVTATPTFSPVAGTYTSAQSVSISSTTTGASFRYTTDGSTPTSTVGTLYGGPVPVGVTETLKAIAFKTGMADSGVASAAYTINLPVVTPTFSPTPGTYTSVQSVTISTITAGASIRYTTDGSTPTSTVGTLYSAPVSVGVTETLNAIAFKAGLPDSTVASALYTINLPVATPTFSPTAGTFSSTQNVTISTTTAGASIRYTTDGSTPTSTVGTLYSAPVSVGVTETLDAIAFKAGLPDSTVASALYTINLPVATPTFSPTAGTFSSTQNVTISTTTAGASIRYTTDGSTPTSNVGTVYSAPVAVSATETINAIAYKAGLPDSAVASSLYTITPPVATPTFSPTAGSYTTTQTVTIGTTTAGAAIRYTTDGSAPTSTVGTVYSAPVSVDATETLKAIGYKAGLSDSAVASAAYVIPITVSVAPSTITLYGGQTQQYTATVAHNANTAVAWTLNSGALGTISATGLYTAPATIAAPATDTVIATSQADNTTTGTAAITLSQPISVVITPLTATLHGGQTQQFSATVTNATNGAVTWTMTPLTGAGTLDSTGLYTPPATVATQQSVTITAKSQADNATIGTATITLMPPITVTVLPLTSSISGGQTQLFTATLAGITNQAVTWSLSAGAEGAIDATGLYTAPACINTSHTIMVIATSMADPTQKSSVTASLIASNAYAYHKQITIDHTKVSNTDQTNFPVLISTTDAALQSVANSGHVANQNGYDIAFASDAACVARLDYELETWSPSSGQLAAWVRIPLLSHLQDTSIYLCYGNSTISTDQSNRQGVWDSNYRAVYHFSDSASNNTVLDSTQNANSGAASANTSGKSAAGKVGGALTFNGSNDAINIGNNASLNMGNVVTVEAWINPSSLSSREGVFTTRNSNNSGSFQLEVGPGNSHTNDLTVTGIQTFVAESVNNSLTTNAWQHVVYTRASGSADTLYVNGQPVALQGSTPSYTFADNTAAKFIGEGTSGQQFFPGLIDEVRISGIARSADWIATEYNNQNSPSTFFTAGAESDVVSVTPAAISLASSQTQQFAAAVSGSCGASISWTLNPAGVGTVSPTGLYTAPATLTSPQTVILTATSVTNGADFGIATIALVPTVTVSPTSVTLLSGQTQQFSATVNLANTAVNWTINPTTLGSISPSGLYTAPACITGNQTITVVATSVSDPTKTATASITLQTSGTYGYSRTVIIKHAKIPNADQVNFPFLFNTTDPAFATLANGGHVTSNNGYDIFFSTDPAGATRLDHELEQYNPVTGQIVAWVRIPNLSHTTDTTLYVFYGNSSITVSQENKTGVWDSNYGGVWHLRTNGATLSTLDSTSHANNGTVSGTVSAAPAQVGGGALFTGSPNYIDAGNNSSVLPTHTGTFSVWVNYTTLTNWGVPMGNGNVDNDTNGALFWIRSSGQYNFEVNGPGGRFNEAASGSLSTGQWYNLVGSWDGTTVRLYNNGVLVASGTQGTDASPVYHLNLGVDGGRGSTGDYLNGTLDEARVSNIARSADWIAAEYNNQSAPGSFYTILSEGHTVIVTPGAITLGGAQTQQFSAALAGSCNSAVTWTMIPSGIGTLSASGLYTAPSTIATVQNIVVKATSVSDSTNSGTAAITLVPVVTVTPTTITLLGGQTQQFAASVTLANTSVTWTISPTSAGSISASGLYTAPACITIGQSVTVTAKSVADPTQTATATITLQAGSLYGYRRAIVIDHTKVPNTDQTNFPFLFNTTDPALATVANGGRVTNASGYDIIFSTDPTGVTKLDHEFEQYNPVTGQVAAWVRIPTLSHTADTILYVFYGNSLITTSQQNGPGVWDSNFSGVWHFSTPGTVSATDATINARNGTLNGSPTVINGQIGHAANFFNSNDNIAIPTITLGSAPYTISAWFNLPFPFTGSWNTLTRGVNNDHQVIVAEGNNYHLGSYGNTSGGFFDSGFSMNSLGSGWHHLAAVGQGTSTVFYVDGAQVGTIPFKSGAEISFLGNYQGGGQQFGGTDELRISTGIARSADWIAAEFNNQNSPGTFYGLESENASIVVAPGSSILYGAQTQQFAASFANCGTSTVTWSLNPAGLGTVNANGLYTAPASITTQQTVAVTATSQADNTQVGAATVKLYPPVSISLVPATINVAVGQTQQFTANVSNALNPAVVWTIAPSIGSINAAGLYTAPSSIGSATNVTITATSAQDSSKVGTAIAVVLPFAGAPVFSPPPATYGIPASLTITSASPSSSIRYTTDGSTPSETVGTLYTSPIPLSANTTFKAIAYGSGMADSSVVSASYSFVTATSTVQYLFTDSTTQGSWQGVYGREGYNVIGGSSANPSYATVTPSGQSTFVWAASTTDVRALESAATGTARVAGTWDAGTFNVDVNFSDTSRHEVGFYLLDWDNGNRTQTITVLDAATNSVIDIRTASGFQNGQYWIYAASGHVIFRFTIVGGPNAVVAGVFFDPTGVRTFPRTTTLAPNHTQQFTTLVDSSPNTTVTWSVNPNLGSITSAGLYTAPGDVPTQQAVTITATSVADPSKSGSSIATLLPGVTGGAIGQVMSLIADLLCRRPHIAPTVDAGADQYPSLSCTGSQCSAGATLTGTATSYYLAPGDSLSYGWNLLSGPAPVVFGSPASTSTSVTVTAPGLYTLQFTVSDGITTASAVTHLSVNPSGANSSGNMSLSPSFSGPAAINTPVSLIARALNFAFGVASNAPIAITVTGANPQTATVISDSNGNATFTYSGVNPGTDSIVAVFTPGTLSGPLTSAPSTVTWINPAVILTSSPVTGRFFTDDGSGVFNTAATQTPVFTQVFPAINFDPAAGTIPGNTSGVTNQTRPFTDIVTNSAGSYAGAVTAQGSGYQAGAGSLYQFSAVFTGSLNVPAAGPVTFTVTSDDAFLFGIGNGATRTSGPQVNTPATTPFQSYTAMGGVNQRSAPTPSTIVVNFPAAGAYPYEIDYAKGGDSHLTLTLQANGAPIPAAALLTLTPTTVPTTQTAQLQQFMLTATNANGAVLSNLPVTFTVTGVNAQNRFLTTDGTGQIGFAYAGDPLVGADVIQAAAHINGADVYSNSVVALWNNGTNQAPVVDAGGSQTLVLPAAAILNGNVSDDGLPNNTLTITWTKLSGPGTVTFDNANQAATAAQFSNPGTYTLQLSATDGTLTTNSTATITVNANTNISSGWFLTPVDGSTITGQVPVTLVAGITLVSGTLTYYPVNHPEASVTSNVTGSGQIAMLDATLLNNGGYFILLNGTNSLNVTQNNQVYVTAVGDYKPGRVTATITDLTVPAPGLAIQIQRTYDSLKRSTIGDFGYGWNLGINVQTEVSASGDVTLTLNGQRRTFYFTPPPNGVFTFYYTPQYTAEPGLFGSLVNTGDNCSGVLQRVGNLWQCAINNAGQLYQASGFQYTDAYGRVYTMSAGGSLQSVRDLSNNTLTVTPTGITSSDGLGVPFVRDTSGRITQITDPLGHHYLYNYDPVTGNLTSVTYPTVPSTQAQYSYDPTNLLTSEIDQNGHTAGSTTYYTDGKLKSVTDAVGNMTQYAYDVPNFKTTITNPDGGTVVTVTDAYGKPLTITESVSSGIQRTTTHVYDANHNETSMTDPLDATDPGHHTTFYTYDANGFRSSLKDPLNNLWTATFNVVGGPTGLTNPLTQSQNVSYDTSFRISSITDSIGTVSQYTYNTLGLPLTLVDARGNTSTYVYDQYGNRTSSTDPLGRTTATTYDTNGNLTRQTDPRGNSTTYAYDTYNRRTSMTDAAGKLTQYTYDGNGNKLSETDRNGHTTTYTYDNADRVTHVLYADSTTRSYTYDFRGNKLTEVDQLGHTTIYAYDLVGRMTSMTVASGTTDAATTTYTYDGDNHKLTQTDPRGNTTKWTYDAAGRSTSVKDAVGNLTQYGYDPKGQRTSMVDAKNRMTAYTYDSRGRQLITTTPDGKSLTKGYDGLGLVTSILDEESRNTQYGFDAASQLTSVTDALNQVTRFTYDPAGNKLTQVDANTHTTSYAYDILNRRTSRTIPLGQTESFTYDFEGNMATRKDFNGRTTTYAFDPLNRLQSRTPDAFFSEPAISFTYTATGRRLTMSDASGNTSYTYNNRDQVLSKATPEGTLTYSYDAAGNVTSVLSSNTNGTSVAYSWDANNRLSSVTDNRTTGTTNYSYDATNQVASIAYPNGVTHTYGYDNRDRMTTLGLNGPSGVIANYTQTFSFSGRKLSAAESSGRTENYSYDSIYRLLNQSISDDPTSVNNGGLIYALDPVGNRQSLTSTLAALQSQASTYDNNDRISGDTFDANGNTLASNSITYGYDFEDRLLSASSGVQITYDGDGNRTAETVAGVTTKFLVDELTPTRYAQVTEEIVSGAVTAQYTYGITHVSQRRGPVSYYGFDGGGSIRQLFDNTGATTDTYAYDAFGGTVARTGTTVNPYQYRGEQYDASLQMYYLRARYYRPQVGRFLSPDSYQGKWRPLTLNRFLYGDGDPVNTIDPSGHESIFSWSRIAAYFGPLYVAAQQVGEYARGLGSLGEFSQWQAEELDEAATWLAERADFLGEATQDLTDQTGRITAAAAQVLDKAGNVLQVVSLSGDHLTGEFVDEIVAPFEIPIYGADHAEVNIVTWALDNGYKIISIAASRGICLECEGAIAAAQAAQNFKIFVGTLYRGY